MPLSFQVVFICGLGILILGTAANIYAEEAYSESHSAILDLPPNLKEIEAKFDLFQPQQQAQLPVLMDNHNRIGGKSFNDPLSFNRSAFCRNLTCLFGGVWNKRIFWTRQFGIVILLKLFSSIVFL